jgi:hypothetical protein
LNQLSALLRNWETYEKMMAEYNSEDNINIAMKEAELSANNWSGSLNKVKNSWTELVNKVVTSDEAVAVLNTINDKLQEISSSETARGIEILTGLAFKLAGAWKEVNNTLQDIPFVGNLFGIDNIMGTKFFKYVGKISNWFNKDAKAAEEYAKKQEELRQAYKSNQEEQEKEINTLRSLSSEYIKLVSSTDDIKSIESDLLSLQSKIINQYGERVSGLDLVNKGLEENIRLLSEQEKIENRKFLSENQESIQAAKKMFGVDSLGDNATETHKATALSVSKNDNVARIEAQAYYQEIKSILQERYADAFENIILESEENAQKMGKSLSEMGTFDFKIKSGITSKEQLEVAQALVSAYEQAFSKYKNFAEIDTDSIMQSMYNWLAKLSDGYNVLADSEQRVADIQGETDFEKSKDYDRYIELINKAVELNQKLNSGELSSNEQFNAWLDLDEVEKQLLEIANEYPAAVETINANLDTLGLHFSQASNNMELAKEIWTESLEEAQKGVVDNVDKIKAAMKKLYSGEAVDAKSAWDIINLDDDRLLENIRVNSNGEFIFDLKEIVSLKDQIIQKEIEERQESLKSDIADRNKLESQIILEKKLLETKKAQLAAAKAPGSMATNVNELESETQNLEASIKSNQDAVDAYSYSIQRNRLYIDYLNSSMGDLSDTTEMLNAQITKLKNEVEELNNKADALLKAQEHVIDGIIDKFEDELDVLEKQKDALNEQLDALEKQKDELESIIDDYKTVSSYVQETISKQIEEIEDNKKAVEEYYDNLIDKLKQENEEREDAIEYEEKLANLANAQRNKVRVYDQERGWVYDTDKDAVKKAQNELATFENEQQIKSLEKEKDEALKPFDEQIEELEEYSKQWKEAVDSITEAENELIAQQILGSNWREKIANRDTTTLNNFKTAYSGYNTKLKQLNNGEIKTLKDHISAIEDDIDAKKKAVQAWKDYKTEVTNTANEIKNGLEDYVKYLGTVNLTENSNADDRVKNLERFKTSYSELMTLIKNKNSTIEEAQEALSNLSKAGDSLTSSIGSSSSGGGIIGSIKNSIGGFSDDVTRLSKQFDKFKETVSGFANVISAMSIIFGSAKKQKDKLDRASAYLDEIGSFNNGGTADYTGLAMVHGSKTSSETVFSAAQSKKLLGLVEALPNFKVSNPVLPKTANKITTNNIGGSTVNISNMTVVANNPQEFERQMNSYLKTKLTQSKVY